MPIHTSRKNRDANTLRCHTIWMPKLMDIKLYMHAKQMDANTWMPNNVWWTNNGWPTQSRKSNDERRCQMSWMFPNLEYISPISESGYQCKSGPHENRMPPHLGWDPNTCDVRTMHPSRILQLDAKQMDAKKWMPRHGCQNMNWGVCQHTEHNVSNDAMFGCQFHLVEYTPISESRGTRYLGLGTPFGDGDPTSECPRNGWHITIYNAKSNGCQTMEAKHE